MRVLDIREVFVVSDDGHRVQGALQVLFPFRKGKNDGKELSVVDVIIMLSWKERLGEVSTRMEIFIGVFLHKNCSNGKERDIGHDVEGVRNVRDCQDRGGSEDGLESVEGSLMKQYS